MRAESSDVSGISKTHMLILSVSSPDVPNLDLVDLPGLVSARRVGEPDDLPEKSEELLREFITEHRDHALFLAVCRATTPPNTSPVLGRLIQEMEIEQQTLGIFSMCDEFSEVSLERNLQSRLLGEARVDARVEAAKLAQYAPALVAKLDSGRGVRRAALVALGKLRG